MGCGGTSHAPYLLLLQVCVCAEENGTRADSGAPAAIHDLQVDRGMQQSPRVIE